MELYYKILAWNILITVVCGFIPQKWNRRRVQCPYIFSAIISAAVWVGQAAWSLVPSATALGFGGGAGGGSSILGIGGTGASGIGGAAVSGTPALASGGFLGLSAPVWETIGTVVGIGAGIAGATISGVGAIQSANAQKQAAEYNADMMRYSARLSDIRGQQALKKGTLAEKQHRLKVKQLMGQQRASYGGSGVLVDEGSTFDVLAETQHLGDADALTIRHNTAIDVWNIKSQGIGFSNQSSLYQSQADSAMAGGYLSAGSSLLTGVGNAAANSIKAWG